MKGGTMEFVSYELAKKLKEKGFSCKYPLAMYNEVEQFCPLYTSADRNPNIKSVFGNREYYDYDDFDENDFIAPTIEQVLVWLREERNIDIDITVHPSFSTTTKKVYAWRVVTESDGMDYEYKDGIHSYGKYEEAALAGIEYTLDKLL